MPPLQLRDLLRAIDDDFDNVAHWHPLADWLMEQGDPRGELIVIDIALEGEVDNREELLERRSQIIAASAPKLLGETFSKVVAEGYGKVAWRRGFVDEVVYRGDRNLGHRRAVGWLVKLMTTSYEPFALLRTLDLSYTDIVDLAPLAKFPQLSRLALTGCKASKPSLDALKSQRPELVVSGAK